MPREFVTTSAVNVPEAKEMAYPAERSVYSCSHGQDAGTWTLLDGLMLCLCVHSQQIKRSRMGTDDAKSLGTLPIAQ